MLSNTEPHVLEQFIIREALDSLSPRQREAVWLCFWEGMTQEEAAVEMGIAERNIRGLLSRAIVDLRKLFVDGHPKTTIRNVKLG